MKPLILAALCLGACATTPSPAKTVYETEGTYTAAALAENAYIHKPGADPIIVVRLRALDMDAYGRLVPLRMAARNGQAISPSDLDVTISAVKTLADYESQNGVR